MTSMLRNKMPYMRKHLNWTKILLKCMVFLFESDRDDLLFYRGTCKVEINRQEIFPLKVMLPSC